MGLFDGIFNTAPQQQAAADQTAGIQTGLSNLTGSYQTGQNQLQTNYTAGLQPFQQNYTQAQQGTTALDNALGLNGPSGNAAAVAGFQNNPGYQFAVQQGENAILANAAKTGQLNSGNTNLDLSQWVTQNANQNWNDYVSKLQPYQSAANNAASGIGTLYAGLGTGLNANSMGLGNAQYGANASIGNANANRDLAQSGANANILNTAIGAGGALMGFLSDADAKEDIEPVGELYDGQQIYRYRYRGDPRHQIGLIAQEVEDRHPDAVFDFGGMRGVDYRAATDLAASYADDLMRMAA